MPDCIYFVTGEEDGPYCKVGYSSCVGCRDYTPFFVPTIDTDEEDY